MRDRMERGNERQNGNRQVCMCISGNGMEIEALTVETGIKMQHWKCMFSPTL